MAILEPARKSALVLAAALALGSCGGSGSGSGDSPQAIPYVEAKGVVDPAFGDGGTGLVPLSNSYATEIVELEDGSLLVGGTNPFVAKMTPQGHLDISFAVNGLDSTRRGTRRIQTVKNITPLSPGRIAIVEEHNDYCFVPPPFVSECEFADVVARRIDATGNADPTYGSGGMGVLPKSQGAVVVVPSGRVMSFPIRPLGGRPSEFGVASLDPAGQRDAAFETRAQAALQCGGRFDPPLARINSVGAAGAGNKIVVAAAWGGPSAMEQGICVSRLNEDGTIDVSFAEQGHQTFALPANADSNIFRVLLRSSGEVVVALVPRPGYFQARPALLFLTASGAKDASVVPGGVQSNPVILVDSIFDLAVQPDGKVVAVGENGVVPGDPSSALDGASSRATRSSASAGNYDAGFGAPPGGFASLTIVEGPIRPYKVIIDRRGGVLAAGSFVPIGQPVVLRLR